MGSAVLERSRQPAGRCLSGAQTGRAQTRIPHDQYPQELQKVRMYLADRNVFGVDLNPVAVELAEVSIWLNAIYGEQEDNGQPLPARVPWFGYQLFAGNSLICARHQVYNAAALKKGAKPAWHEAPPRRATADSPRRPDEIWHFLLPDPGMGNYTDKVAKSLYPDDFARLKAWRKALTAPLGDYEVARLQQLSQQVEALWEQHTAALARDRARTEDQLRVWPHDLDAKSASGADVESASSYEKSSDDRSTRVSRAQKEAIRQQGLLNEDGDLATPFRRLKLVMDYWCALWFWPITRSADLPSPSNGGWRWVPSWRATSSTSRPKPTWCSASPQASQPPAASNWCLAMTMTAPPCSRRCSPADGFDVQPELQAASTTSATAAALHDRLGQLRISKLRQHFARVAVVEGIAEQRRFMHWELCFADVPLGVRPPAPIVGPVAALT